MKLGKLGFEVLVFLLFIVIFIVVAKQVQVASPQATVPATNLTQPTKTTNCIVNGKLPDTACTPGAIIASATTSQICASGYAKSVRNVTQQEKDLIYSEYGITTRFAGEYEIDHLISLELGGSNDRANLWPEASDPKPGFHEKDAVENYLHAQVCAGKLSLAQAQQEIASNWLQIYQTLH